MLLRVSLIVLLYLAVIITAGHSSEEQGGGRSGERHGPSWPWYWRRLGRHGAAWSSHHGHHGGHHRKEKFKNKSLPAFPPPPFLKDATDDARKEFVKIFESENQTKAQAKKRVDEWAVKQPQSVKDGVVAFERNLTIARAAMRENATAVIQQLQTALDRFSTVLEDDNLTPRETAEKLRNTARVFDRDVVLAVKIIMRNARFRVSQKFFPIPEKDHGPFELPEGIPFHPPMIPLPLPPHPFGHEGPINPFFLPPPPLPRVEENAENVGIFLLGEF